MKKKYFKILPVIVITLIFAFSFTSCEELLGESGEGDENSFWKKLASNALNNVLDGKTDSFADVLFGWPQEDENLEAIEDDISSPSLMGSNYASDIPNSKDLTSKFPPIGNQGRYGTCVAWAVAYNLKTYLEGVDNNLSSSELALPSNQFSPKYLFWALDNSVKGDDCNGTTFEPAFDVLISNGLPTLADVPYDELGDCRSQPPASWNEQASVYKIDNYREIEYTYKSVRDYVAQGRPVVIGAKLGDSFMSWDAYGDVLTSDSYGYTGQHANHAMIVCAYDDNKGSNGAFKVVNSWSPNWGNDGYIWVDYNFFQNEFCFAAFVAANKRTDPEQDESSDYDLVAWTGIDILDTESTNPLHRVFHYDAYNIGEKTIDASEKWNILYLYYNAYDANEFDILVYDYYTDEFNSAKDTDGDLSEHPDAFQPAKTDGGNWWTNIDILPGQSVSDAFKSTTEYVRYFYEMPSKLNGQYYLCLYVDGGNVIAETDESNNMFFVVDDNGEPLTIKDGIISGYSANSLSVTKSKGKAPGKNAKSPSNTTVTKNNVNPYSQNEIQQMIQFHKKNGTLEKKINKFKSKKTGNKGKRR